MKRDAWFPSRLVALSLLCIALLAVSSVALVLQYGRLRTRGMCARVKRDLRTLATAIERCERVAHVLEGIVLERE